jgi:hypothetical protein
VKLNMYFQIVTRKTRDKRSFLPVKIYICYVPCNCNHIRYVKVSSQFKDLPMKPFTFIECVKFYMGFCPIYYLMIINFRTRNKYYTTNGLILDWLLTFC